MSKNYLISHEGVRKAKQQGDRVSGAESRGEGRRERSGYIHTGLASCHSPSCQRLCGPVLSPEEQMCETRSSWPSAPLTWGPEEEPGPCSLLPPLPRLQLACGGPWGWDLSSKGLRAWAPPSHVGSRHLCAGVACPASLKDALLCSGRHAHLSQQLQTRPGLRGAETQASAEEPGTTQKDHSPAP